jgi:hypothetical protein
MPNTVVLSDLYITPDEKKCAEAITPGHLVEVIGSGGTAGQLRRHATADGISRPHFAIESLVPYDPIPTKTKAIDIPYPIGDTVRWIIASPGMLIYAMVPAAAVAIVEGDPLVSNGDGTLKKAGATPAGEVIVAYAAEAINNSGGGAAARIRVRAR